jgi:hypothetical protein
VLLDMLRESVVSFEVCESVRASGWSGRGEASLSSRLVTLLPLKAPQTPYTPSDPTLCASPVQLERPCTMSLAHLSEAEQVTLALELSIHDQGGVGRNGTTTDANRSALRNSKRPRSEKELFPSSSKRQLPWSSGIEDGETEMQATTARYKGPVPDAEEWSKFPFLSPFPVLRAQFLFAY